MTNTILANWNGTEMPLNEVKVSVLDRGFLFGDAVYEVLRIYSGKFFHPEDHLDRLKASLNSLKISGVDISELRTRLNKTLEHSALNNGLAYLQITRGEAVRKHRYPENCVPNILIYVDHFDDPYAEVRETGVSAVTHPDIRWRRNDIKATSLAANCMAAQYAYEHGCPEVIFISPEGLLTEGSHTSIFGVKDGKLLVAPASASVLPGITKKVVLDLAKAGNITVADGKIKKEDIHNLDEIFMAGTPEEIIAITKVDDKPIGNGHCGPIVRKLQAEYKKLIDENV